MALMTLTTLVTLMNLVTLKNTNAFKGHKDRKSFITPYKQTCTTLTIFFDPCYPNSLLPLQPLLPPLPYSTITSWYLALTSTGAMLAVALMQMTGESGRQSW